MVCVYLPLNLTSHLPSFSKKFNLKLRFELFSTLHLCASSPGPQLKAILTAFFWKHLVMSRDIFDCYILGLGGKMLLKSVGLRPDMQLNIAQFMREPPQPIIWCKMSRAWLLKNLGLGLERYLRG